MGDPERAHRLRPLPGRLQHQRDDARGQGQADPLAQPPRGRRGLALRQGPLRLRAPARRRPDRGSAAQDRHAASSRSAGRTRSTRPSGCCARAGPVDRDRALRQRDGRAGLRAREAPARGARRARRRAARGGARRRSTTSARRSRRSATRRSSSCSATSPSLERAPIVDLWIKAAPPQRARRVADRAARGEGRGRGADHATTPSTPRWFARDLDAAGGLLPAAHAERPRRRRRLELRRRRRAGRRRAARC